MPLDAAGFDAFAKLGDRLRELELSLGPKGRPLLAAVQARLAEAASMRANGNPTGALDALRGAMEQLAALAVTLDPAEGMLMGAIARRFSEALATGDKGTVMDAVNTMRHKAGDPKDDPNTEW